ncbi:His Kinase A (phospho-acceptor) domain-containing protein [Thermoflexibacter ruber]|uniref:histidine kinase n=1 Tax=Thermoflexibacter ruber TaxID=1003 RepID=A0A1I2D279_9BACT|nr:His Kinase A (phospho-acceptor) domain-containing protein [Thermoflexibacter ruber]
MNPWVFIGKSIYEVLPVEIYTQIVELLPSLLAGHYHSFEAMFHGQVVLNTLQPIANEEGQVESFVLASIDITERKKNEEKIKERNSLLEEIAWLQSHEMRRPVANILGLMHLIKMEEQDEDRKIRLYLEHLEKATEHLDQVIHKVVAKANGIV